MTGRRKDPVWIHFNEIKGAKSVKAQCKKCNEIMVALVARMRKHLQLKCRNVNASVNLVIDSSAENDSSEDNQGEVTDISSVEQNPEPLVEAGSSRSVSTAKKQKVCSETDASITSLDSFLIRTSVSEKKKLDIQVARCIYGTNSAFQHVEHSEFIKMLELLRPGYKPPNRKQISNELLNEVYDSISANIKKDLKGKIVCMAQDGWSNIHNESIVCICVTDVLEECVHLIDTVDTEDNRHTSDYLLNLAVSSIKTCQEYGCLVRSFVTDNAANMAKMREDLAKNEDLGLPDIITYGCSAHILNLLAHDIDVPGIKSNVKKIVKYFRNSHFAAAKYKQAQGKSLNLPQDVRWNTLADCLESYLSNWHILAKVCSENRVSIDPAITQKVNDVNLKINVQDFLQKLKKISVALDKVQSDSCTIGEATEIWLGLFNDFRTEFTELDIECCKKRFDMAMTPAHFLANLLDHRYQGHKLSEEQLNTAMEYVNAYHPNTMPLILNYRAKCWPFKDYLFTTQAISVKPLIWWLALKHSVNEDTMQLIHQLHTAVASSAGIERLFSSFGIVHTKLRNRLGIEKASKLVTVFKALNRKTIKGKGV